MFRTILYPVDILEENCLTISLPVLQQMAQAFGSSIHLLTVVPDFSSSLLSQYFAEGAQDDILTRARSSLEAFAREHLETGLEITQSVSQGPVYRCIIDESERIDADLIVMTAHRPELKDYLLGPNSAKVVRHSNRSVMVLRG